MVQAFQYNIEVNSRDDLIEMLDAQCSMLDANRLRPQPKLENCDL
jgi:hypothetical protein